MEEEESEISEEALEDLRPFFLGADSGEDDVGAAEVWAAGGRSSPPPSLSFLRRLASAAASCDGPLWKGDIVYLMVRWGVLLAERTNDTALAATGSPCLWVNEQNSVEVIFPSSKWKDY